MRDSGVNNKNGSFKIALSNDSVIFKIEFSELDLKGYCLTFI